MKHRATNVLTSVSIELNRKTKSIRIVGRIGNKRYIHTHTFKCMAQAGRVVDAIARNGYVINLEHWGNPPHKLV